MKVMRCASCGTQNRIAEHSSTQRAVCGRCGFPLRSERKKNNALDIIKNTALRVIDGSARDRWITFVLTVALAGTSLATWYQSTQTRESAPTIARQVQSTKANDSSRSPAPILQGVHYLDAGREPLAPFELVTPVGTESYYVYFLQDARSRVELLVRGGQTFKTRIPLGSYHIVYATGTTWYGKEHLFGHGTETYRLAGTFDFVEDSRGYSGVTIELTKRINGNLHSDKISLVEFLKTTRGL